MGWDRYGYVNNSPVNASDPTGHWEFTVSYNLSAIVNSMLNVTGVSGAEIAKRLDTAATALDVAALAIDTAIAGGDVTSGIIGGTAGAGIALPEGGTPMVVTGPSGALVGMGLFELSPEIRLGLAAGNVLSSTSTALTAVSDLIAGETNDSRSLTLSEKGFQYSQQTVIGRDTLTSAALTTAGWTSPIGLTSAPLQGVALLNDLDMLYPEFMEVV